MYEDMAPKIAKIITEYSQPVREGDLVVIQANTVAEPMIKALYEAILRRGGIPHVNASLPSLGEMFYTLADEKQLTYVNPIARTLIEEVDVYLSIFAGVNTKTLATIDPQKLVTSRKASAELVKIYEEREQAGDLRWCILPWPTEADAQEGEMGLLAYTKFVYEACGLHLDDPVAYWQGMRDKQMRLVDYLSDKHEAVIKGPGIEMSFNFTDRLWISDHGDCNFPAGEIFTGPIEDSVNGWVDFSMKTIYGGREVNGVHLSYKDGQIVDASAQKGEDYLISQLDLDEGARRMGEFAIGTNWGIQQVTGSTLFDEKIGGTIHMAVGRSIHETKGVNQSIVHWDMVHDMKQGGEIYIDGELFYRAGEFMI